MRASYLRIIAKGDLLTERRDWAIDGDRLNNLYFIIKGLSNDSFKIISATPSNAYFINNALIVRLLLQNP